MSKVVALSGGIGSGKTTVRKLLDELGATTICADAIVHELQAPGSPLLQEIAAAFGSEVLDSGGALDRAALGEIVFSDPESRARLGTIMHPPVMALTATTCHGRHLLAPGAAPRFSARRSVPPARSDRVQI